jgi:hypothetical protein
MNSFWLTGGGGGTDPVIGDDNSQGGSGSGWPVRVLR